MSLTTEEWLEAYRTAWVRKDADGAAAIFTETARYRKHPFEEPHRGRDGVHAYWTEVTSTQAEVELRYGVPVVEGRRVAVEWWVTMLNGGAEVTIAGEFLLLFDESGLCDELREYWHVGEGRREPPPGWGA